jgi:hypothetical protein
MSDEFQPGQPAQTLEEALHATLLEAMSEAIRQGQHETAERVLQALHSFYRPAQESAVILRPDFARKSG